MNEYKKVRLGDVATYINGYAFKPTDWTEKGLPIIRIQDLTGNDYETNHCDKEIDKKYYIKNGDVLISWSASLGIYEWLKGDALLNQHIFKVVFDKLDVDKKYFMYEIKSLLSEMSKNTHGSTMHHITKPVFDNMPFYIPPIETQKQIAATLDKVTKIISENKKLLEKYDLLIKSRFIEMFGDVSTSEYKYETRKLGTVANVGSSHRVFTTEFVEKGIPFYRGTEIGELANGHKPMDPYYISEEHYNRLADNDTKPRIGDLLMPSICNKGQVWMVDTEEPFYYKDGRVLSISPDKLIYNPRYLQYFMREKTLVEYPKLGSGSTFAEFKIFLLKNIDVLTPPKQLQDDFAAFVQQIDKSKFVVQKSLEKAETLYKSLMQEYFG